MSKRVLNIMSEPIPDDSGGWEVDVRVLIYGRKRRETLYFETKEEALALKEDDLLIT